MRFALNGQQLITNTQQERARAQRAYKIDIRLAVENRGDTV